MHNDHPRAKLSRELEGCAETRTNHTGADDPRSKSVARLFEEIAAAYPNETAVAFNSTQLTYAQLNKRANRLAHRLRRVGVGTEMKVGVCLERSPELIIALVGILKAGAAYVPFDPSYPRERLDFMRSDTGAAVMVTQKSLAAKVLDNRNLFTVLMDEEEDASRSAANDDENPAPAGGPRSLAYVMYTSGSTGRPKGVLVENRGVVRLVRDTNYCSFGRNEVFLQYAPISFDASTFEIWGALLHGSKLVVMPPEARSLEELGRAIEQHGVTTLWLTAGVFNLFVDERLDGLRPVRQLLAGGDTLSAKHVRRVLEKFHDMTVINGYGPTEGTTFTCCHPMKHGDNIPDSVPLGRPISNTRVYILDERLQPVASGAIGELCAGGDGVARGYLNAAELTEEKFVSDPYANEPGARMYRTGDLARWRDDGTVEFLGRQDTQVKILGHRIEPGEIEAVLAQYPGVREACVAVNADTAGTKRLVAYYVTNANGAGGLRGIKDFLATKLPAHMLPSFYVPLTSLPLNPNGKVDRAALPPPPIEREGEGNQNTAQSHGSALEKTIADVWKKILRTERVGLDDNFFDLGGDSLLIVAAHSQLQKLLQIEIKLTDLFGYTTIRSLAKNLGAAAPSFVAAQEQAKKQRAAFAKQKDARQKRAAEKELASLEPA